VTVPFSCVCAHHWYHTHLKPHPNKDPEPQQNKAIWNQAGSNADFKKQSSKSRMPALLLGILTSVLAVGALLIAEADPSGMSSHYLSVSTLWALNGWCWVTVLLGFGRKHLSLNHKFLQRSNEFVLPFYILHQSVIAAIAFYVGGMARNIRSKSRQSRVSRMTRA